MRRCFALLGGIAVAVGLCQAMGSEASKLKYPRPGPCSCVPNAQNFGYFQTQWRRWPCESRPEIDNPQSIGRIVLPTPEAQPEQVPLPQGAPMLQPPSGGGILPPSVDQDGPAAAPTLELPPELRLTSPIAPPEPGLGLPGLPVEPKSPSAPAPKPDSPPAEKPVEKPAPTAPPKPQDVPQRSENEPSLPDGSPDGARHGTAAALKPSAGERSPVVAASSVQPAPALDSQPKPPRARSPKAQRADSRVAAIAVSPPDDAGQQRHVAARGLKSDGGVEPTSQKMDQTPVEPAAYVTAETPAEAAATDAAPAAPTVALQGFCPVELVRDGRWTPGDLRWTVVHEGRIYRLSGASQRREFLEHPEAFVPVRSGNDSVLAVDEHRTVSGKLTHCAVYNGRLYMFSSAASQSQFNKEPERYAGK